MCIYIYIYGGDPTWWVPFIQKSHFSQFYSKQWPEQTPTNLCFFFMFPSFFFFLLSAFFCLSLSSLPLLFDILKPKKVHTKWGLWHIYIYIYEIFLDVSSELRETELQRSWRQMSSDGKLLPRPMSFSFSGVHLVFEVFQVLAHPGMLPCLFPQWPLVLDGDHFLDFLSTYLVLRTCISFCSVPVKSGTFLFSPYSQSMPLLKCECSFSRVFWPPHLSPPAVQGATS